MPESKSIGAWGINLGQLLALMDPFDQYQVLIASGPPSKITSASGIQSKNVAGATNPLGCQKGQVMCNGYWGQCSETQ